MELLVELHAERNDTYLVISHDLAVVQLLCDYIVVMRNGSVVEQGSTDQIIHRPQKEYTQRLLASVLDVPRASNRAVSGVGA